MTTVKVRTGIHAGARKLNHNELMFVPVRRTGR